MRTGAVAKTLQPRFAYDMEFADGGSDLFVNIGRGSCGDAALPLDGIDQEERERTDGAAKDDGQDPDVEVAIGQEMTPELRVAFGTTRPRP